MIPEFDSTGNLPPGVHLATWDEVAARYGDSIHRKRLLQGLAEVIAQLRIAGCERLYLDGSFITQEPNPADYDACYEIRGMDPRLIDPVLLDLSPGRVAQKAKYFGEVFPASATADVGYNFFRFFQLDKMTGAAKGIIALNLRQGTP